MSETAAPAAPRRVLPVRWLLSPGADLTLLVGSVLVSYGLLFFWSSGRLSLTGLIAIWVFGLHGPHFWGTMSRTFLDPSEWRERGPVLKRSLLWFLVGPAMVGAGLLLKRATGYEDLVLLFFFLAALWAFQHVIKQHFGFVALYRAKHKEFEKGGFTFLKWYLLVSMWAPVLLVLVRAEAWFMRIPLAMVWGRSVGLEEVLSTTGVIGDACMVVFWAAQVVFAGYLVRQVVTGRGLNVPVLLIVAASVPLNYFVCFACLDAALTGPAGNFEAYAFVPLVTSYHNIQYHALIWHFNREKYGARGAEFGLAGKANASLLTYVACGVAYTLVTIGIEYYPFNVYDLVGFARDTYVGEILAAGIWGFSFLHYYVDAQIWHVRSDENLQRVLGFAKPRT
ncbi:MAG: hypothetical protein AAF682_19000 [Planctomycetota bacterium]